MKKIISVAISLLVITVLPGWVPAECENEDSITWLILDLPPFFITKGSDRGKGLADQIQKMVSERLDGYRSSNKVANASRIAKELNEDKCVCFAGEFYGNPGFLTSMPTILLLPHNIIVRKKDLHLFGDGNNVSLKRLLQNKNLIFGTAKDRLYGPELDIVLKKNAKGKNIYQRSGKDTLDGLVGMLIKGRVDYLIEYPVSITYAAKRLGVSDKLATITIDENVDAPPIRGAIRCPDTEWGRKTINDINKILVNIRALPEYRKIIKDWAVPPGKEGEYWKIYKEQVLNIRR
jgi:polar amino acid transport system substrate-binding protein